MTPEYVQIQAEEFEEFLLPQGFVPWQEEGVKEDVYGKPVGCLVLKVFTTLEGGASREVGEDAIRTALWTPLGNRIASEKRVNRVGEAAEVFSRLQIRIDELLEKAKAYEPLYAKLAARNGGKLRDFRVDLDNPTAMDFRHQHLVVQKIEDDVTSKGKPCKKITCLTDFTYIRAKLVVSFRTMENSSVWGLWRTFDIGQILTIRRHGSPGLKPWKGTYYLSFGNYGYCFSFADIDVERFSPDEPEFEVVEDKTSGSGDVDAQDPTEERDGGSETTSNSEDENVDVIKPEAEAVEPVSVQDLSSMGLAYSFETLNPMQSKVWRSEAVQKGENILVASPTASGKTVVAEMAIARSTEQYKIGIYLTPFKSLAEEKFADWQVTFKDLKISILTGDYRMTEGQVEELKTSDIIIMTTEMLHSRCIKYKEEKNSWIFDVGCVVVDEAHLISSDGRGDKLEVALMTFTELNPEAQILLLSATINELEKLSKWLEELTNRPCKVVTSNYRPCQLKIHYQPFDDSSGVWDTEGKFIIARELVARHKDDKWLIFTPSRHEAVELAKRFSDMDFNADYHNAALSLGERREVEARFKEGDLQILCATTTLSTGVNLPARRVIVFGVHRGLNEMDAMDILQCCGRAGRPKYDTEGDAYILLPMSTFQAEKRRMKEIRIKSTLGKELDLLFHLNCDIYRGRIKNYEEAEQWWGRTFAYKLYNFLIDVKQFIQKLIKMGMVSEKEIDGASYLTTTALGKVAAQMYFYPSDIAAWQGRFHGDGKTGSKEESASIDVEPELLTAWRLIHPSEVAQAPYVTKQERGDINKWAEQNMNELMRLKSATGAGLEEIELKWLYYNYQCFYADDKQGAVRQIRMDLERWFETLKFMSSTLGWHQSPIFWKEMELRMRYGVPKEAVELVTIKGIGHARAMKMYNAGIKSLRDVVAQKDEVIKLLGQAVGNNAVRQAARGRKKDVDSQTRIWDGF
jgi:replicative superfamily II helicase